MDDLDDEGLRKRASVDISTSPTTQADEDDQPLEVEDGEDAQDDALDQEHNTLLGGKEKDGLAYSEDGGPAAEPIEGALSNGDMIDIWSWDQVGYLPQYFAVGILMQGLPSTVYGFFLGYLNVPSYVYATAVTMVALPWSFKAFIGMVTDCCPIFGLHRKPYIVLGWCIAVAALLTLSLMEVPPPYWCQDKDGRNIMRHPDDDKKPATPCNPDSATQGGVFAMVMMVAALGYMMADVAADGLTVEYARREPKAMRGTIQTTIYLVRTGGQVAAVVLVGFFMNRYEYNGSFPWGLSVNQIYGIMAIPAAIMIPLSWVGIKEVPKERHSTFKEYLASVWTLLSGKAMFFVITYQFGSSLVGSISTTAGGNVKMYWAGVENLQNQLFSLMGLALFALGLIIVKKFLLNESWRIMLATTTIGLVLIDSVFVFLTVFKVVRNQYFYLGETVLVEIPAAANFIVGTFVIVEMASDGTEGVVYGLLTTVSNLGGPFGRAIGNQIYGEFTPSLSDAQNYIEDEPSFRTVVAWSFVISYGLSFASLLFLFFLPPQKQETQDRKQNWPSSSNYAVATLVVVGVGFTYSLVVNILSMLPSTMCLQFAGGDGC